MYQLRFPEVKAQYLLIYYVSVQTFLIHYKFTSIFIRFFDAVTDQEEA